MMPDLRGRIIVVTGANANLGYETALQLALANGHVVLACRNAERGKAAEDKMHAAIQQRGGCTGIAEYMALDVGDLGSIAAFTDAFQAKFHRLDILVNNAGMKAINHSATVDGFETQFGVNHLGHFALTARLFNSLRRSENARIINVSSISHHYVSLDFDNLNAAPPQYEAMDVYRKSKLATMLFAYELDRRLKRAGVDNVISVPCHPGVTESNLLPNLEKTYNWAIVRWVISLVHKIPFAQSNAMGALCVLNAATDSAVRSGEYIGPHGLMEFYGYPCVVEASRQSHDLDAAQRLWAVSEELTHVPFEIK